MVEFVLELYVGLIKPSFGTAHAVVVDVGGGNSNEIAVLVKPKEEAFIKNASPTKKDRNNETDQTQLLCKRSVVEAVHGFQELEQPKMLLTTRDLVRTIKHVPEVFPNVVRRRQIHLTMWCLNSPLPEGLFHLL